MSVIQKIIYRYLLMDNLQLCYTWKLLWPYNAQILPSLLIFSDSLSQVICLYDFFSLDYKFPEGKDCVIIPIPLEPTV
jgi:hypothetical protein